MQSMVNPDQMFGIASHVTLETHPTSPVNGLISITHPPLTPVRWTAI